MQVTVFPDEYQRRQGHHLNHGFYLDEGAAELSEWFTVEVHRYANALVVTEADPLIAYILSLPDIRATLNELHESDPDEAAYRIDTLSQKIRDHLAIQGTIHAELDIGIVRSIKDDGV